MALKTENADKRRKMVEHYIESYGETVSRLCFSLCKNSHDAEDLYQETWIKILRALDSYDASKPFDTWVARICVNCFIDMCRKKKNITYLDSEEHLEQLLNSGRISAAEAEDYSRLYSAIEKLTPEQRAAVSLFYFDDYTGRQAAQMLGKTYTHFRVILMRARKKLRKELER